MLWKNQSDAGRILVAWLRGGWAGEPIASRKSAASEVWSAPGTPLPGGARLYPPNISICCGRGPSSPSFLRTARVLKNGGPRAGDSGSGSTKDVPRTPAVLDSGVTRGQELRVLLIGHLGGVDAKAFGHSHHRGVRRPGEGSTLSVPPVPPLPAAPPLAPLPLSPASPSVAGAPAWPAAPPDASCVDCAGSDSPHARMRHAASMTNPACVVRVEKLVPPA